MKQLPNFISDANPVSHLQSELATIEKDIRLCARRGDEAGLVALRNRKRELPELIQRERMKDFASRLSVARSRFGAFDSELIKAQDEARTLGSEAETKIPLLEAEIERLRSQWAFAQSETESLQYAVRQAREELTRIQDERESLLLSEPV